MKTEQRLYEGGEWSSESVNNDADLVLAFIAPKIAREGKSYDILRGFFPNAEISITSTAGEIYETEVYDESISVTALTFDNTPIKAFTEEAADVTESFSVGEKLATSVKADDLKYVLVFIDGLGINGGHFLDGLKSVLDEKVGITGGLAGDGFDPHETHVSLNGEIDRKNRGVIIGFYGDSIKIGNSSFAGFDTFGIERKVTKSHENVVFELDGEPMLGLYKKYLGPQAEQLPGAGVNFPLSISKVGEEDWLLRSILTIDEKDGSITFSGNVPQGYRAYLMKTNFAKLVEEAGKAGHQAVEKNPSGSFALLVSCAGRRIILKQRVEEEVEEIREAVGEDCAIGGFYSYGEIGISTGDLGYELHNETMTVALFSEE